MLVGWDVRVSWGCAGEVGWGELVWGEWGGCAGGCGVRVSWSGCRACEVWRGVGCEGELGWVVRRWWWGVGWRWGGRVRVCGRDRHSQQRSKTHRQRNPNGSCSQS